MRIGLAWSVWLGMLVAGAASPAAGADEEFVTAALEPFWRAREMKEPVFFLQSSEDARPEAALLFRPEEVLRVTSATRETVYEAGRDYVVDEEAGTLRLPVGSRIPFKTREELYPLLSTKGPKIRGKRGDPSRGIFWGEGALYHGLQIEVSYRFRPAQWEGYVPRFAGERLPRTMKKLRGGEPVKILLSGDSISEGYNASKFTKAEPGCPAYGELVARGLERAYGSEVTFENFARAGWRAERGLKQAMEERLGQKKPDLVIIAFGMNDVGARDAAAYQRSVRGIMEVIRKDSPETEFILVASMLGNAEWRLPMEQFPLYRDALAELCGGGVVLADMTAMWQGLLERKSFYDLTGNGVNHPNDFGHRVYAQAILALLVEPSGNGGAAGPLKVFILAGQSNMQGHGRVDAEERHNGGKGSLEWLVKDSEKAARYRHLTGEDGEWTARDDVWIWYLGRKGKLAPGFGAREGLIGPELGFGHAVGEALEEPVLLVKLAWGGKSLAKDFRPPSSGGDVGEYYTEVVKRAKEVLGNVGEHFPEHAGRDVELAGFGWHQGWNDRVNQAFNDAYEENLANFIRDVRKEFGVANLPFVIAETGMSGVEEKHPRALSLMRAQAAVAEHEEFRGNVAFVGTKEFYRPKEVSPSGQAYHWNHNAETYYLIGDAMGEAMMRLIRERK